MERSPFSSRELKLVYDIHDWKTEGVEKTLKLARERGIKVELGTEPLFGYGARETAHPALRLHIKPESLDDFWNAVGEEVPNFWDRTDQT